MVLRSRWIANTNFYTKVYVFVFNSTSGSMAIDNVDNPFTTNGVLSKKADYIISHSTITRTELCIADPDNVHQTEEVLQQSVVTESHATAPGSPLKVGSLAKQNGKKTDDFLVSVSSVEVEVSKATAVSAQPQRAEEVKLKQNKKCCIVQWPCRRSVESGFVQCNALGEDHVSRRIALYRIYAYM